MSDCPFIYTCFCISFMLNLNSATILGLCACHSFRFIHYLIFLSCQGTPNSTPNASGGTKSSKKSGGQKKSLEAAGSMQPSRSLIKRCLTVLNCYGICWIFLDSPKQISLLSSAKSRRHLEAPRNKVSMN